MFAYCGNNPVNRIDVFGHAWEDVKNWFVNTWNEIVDTAQGIIDYFSVPTKEEHYARNDNNPKFPKRFDERYFQDWDDSVFANCHQFTSPDRSNKKYVSEDGKLEAIYDSEGNLVTDVRDIGTYNFVSPNEDVVGHAIKDVIPWIMYGNTADDSTLWYERLGALVGIYEFSDIIPIFVED